LGRKSDAKVAVIFEFTEFFSSFFFNESKIEGKIAGYLGVCRQTPHPRPYRIAISKPCQSSSQKNVQYPFFFITFVAHISGAVKADKVRVSFDICNLFDFKDNKYMSTEKFSRRRFLQAGTIFAAATIVTPKNLWGNFMPAAPDDRSYSADIPEIPEIFKQFQCPQWFKDAKFGLWLHWGPQSIPTKGGGWYARHMYMQKCDRTWGAGAWPYHRLTFGHQADFGYKDICNLWKAEKFDAEETIRLFKKWGARYVATMANHHDNFDLFNSSVHQWNTVNVGPKRDILGEFAGAARRNGLKWMASVHTARAKEFFEPAFGADLDGLRKGVPYDGNLTKADGKGKWWEGLDPQQLYAHKYDAFESELRQRHLDLITDYEPDILYFDDGPIIPLAMKDACIKLYENSLKKNGSIQSIVTVKGDKQGTVRDYEMGIADGLAKEYWQTDTSLNADWFLKMGDQPELNHNARSLKELLVDIVSKRGALMLNVAVYPDGSIPDDQFAVMEEFGAWLNANGEAIYATEPWKTFGEGGANAGGHFSERRAKSEPWDSNILRFTCNKDRKTLYVSVFGNPAGKEITVASLANKELFKGKIKNISVIGGNGENLKWTLSPVGLKVTMPEKLAFTDCNILKVNTTKL
jgi:alpha-L-fucosidase